MKKQKIKVGDFVITKRFAEDEGYEDNDPDKLYFNGVMGECVNKVGIVKNIDLDHIKVHGWNWPISKVLLVHHKTERSKEEYIPFGDE